MEFVLDTHCHTIASGHAYSTFMEYIDEAAVKKLELIAITDHAPNMPGASHEMHFLNLRVIPKIYNGVEILSGVELNIMDTEGTIDLSEGILKGLDVVIASLHPPCIPFTTAEDYTNTIINTMKNPYVKVLGHLGDPRYPLDIKKVVKVAKELGKIIEINNASFKPGSYRVGGDQIIAEMIQECKRTETRIIAGSDSHFHLDLGDFSFVKRVIEDAGIQEELVLNTSVKRFKQALGLNKADKEDLKEDKE